MSQLMLNSGGRRSNRFVVCNQSMVMEEEEVGQCVDDYDGTGWKITRSGLRKTGQLQDGCVTSTCKKYHHKYYFCMVSVQFFFVGYKAFLHSILRQTNNSGCHRPPILMTQTWLNDNHKNYTKQYSFLNSALFLLFIQH